MRTTFRVLITDLDNTLYDWYAFFIPAFYAMISEAAKILDCTESKLIDDIRRVHVRYGDVEHPFALIKTSLVQERFGSLSDTDKIRQFDRPFHTFNVIRKEKLQLFPTVRETLSFLKGEGIVIIGHTDSRSLAAIGRLDKLGIIDFFNAVYCQSRHESSHPLPDRRAYWDALLSKVSIREVRSHKKKPHPRVLEDIFLDEKISPSECVYVGDSKSRDILMAKQAGVYSAWAKYGAWTNEYLYKSLIAISHWTKSEIQEEIAYSAKAKDVEPDLILNEKFAEIKQLYQRRERRSALTG
jgi:FMN phosphatase YigB (HAD superfamily)